MEANTGPDTYYVHVYSDGTVVDMAPVKVVSSCNLDIYTFPFDIQNCTYSFNSYLHAADDIRLTLEAAAEDILDTSNAFMEMQGEWDLINMTSFQPNITDPHMWDYLYIHLILRRRPTLYVVNLIIPSCFLITLDLFSFILPPQSVDRSAFKMTLILGYTVFLLLMNELLPVTGNTIPLINVFFSLCLALMVASLLETIVITNILHSARDRTVPRWLRTLVLEVMARLVCLVQKKPDDQVLVMQNQMAPVILSVDASEAVDSDPHLQVLQNLEKELQAIRQQLEKNMRVDKNTEDWMHIGRVVDRFLFCVYILFITCSFITILVIWTHWYKL
ncbi:5-hydroxytryptamine receptor 3A-like [Sardina pilchardus]|uniref:5-hydroxytryptamine receptor 3A-like n=1 Tax=Sardina pilchardus TaxID=27697 RepID=UPI002E109CA8